MASRTKTVQPGIVTNAGGEQTPSPIVMDAPLPRRVLLRNNSQGGQVVGIAYEASALQQFPFGADAYLLPPGAADVFVVERGESLFVAAGGPALISYAISDAFPIDLKP